MLFWSILAYSAAFFFLVSVVVVFFYSDTPLKPAVDQYLTTLFRKATYETQAELGKTVFKSPDTPGFEGLIMEAKAAFARHKEDPDPAADLYESFRACMDRFFEKLGVPPDKFAAFCKAHPQIAAWLNRVTANVGFSWIVGGAKIETLQDNVVVIRTCHFREQTGEEGCRQMCQKPVEKYFNERMHCPLAVVPQPREHGLGCRVCYGSCSLPKELEW